jgi:hypothetical protein
MPSIVEFTITHGTSHLNWREFISRLRFYFLDLIVYRVPHDTG